jgi:peptidoglycan hydrolase-like protein with peptidoglycan-binding domain
MPFDPKIEQLQEDLLELGIDPGPIDGRVGSKTRGAAHTAAQRNGLTDFTKTDIPDALIAQIHQLAQIARHPLALPREYLDLSEDAAPGWRESYRPTKDITGVTLHQTGCPLTDIPDAEIAHYKATGELTLAKTPSLMRWAKHNIALPGKPAKYVSLKTHLGVTYSGKKLQFHPFEVWGWSAQSFSYSTISIEIAGLFLGVEGDPKTRPAAPLSWKIQRITDAQVEAVKELIRYLKYRFPTIHYLYMHRQATDDRDPDAGSEVCQKVSIPLQNELGLSDGGRGFVKGKGHPIPGVWDPRYKGIPY